MTNAFEILGIEVRLKIDDDSLRAAFREAGKVAHPDAGGEDVGFARLKRAFEVVASPSQRLKHWLELQGLEFEARGTVEDSLMDLFSEVGATSQAAETLIRKRSEAKSALGLALLEGETQRCRESVEAALRKVDAAIATESAGFGQIEESESPDVMAASETVRNLRFLEKWRAGLRGLFARLI